MGLGCFTRHNMHNKPINSHLNVSTHSACNVQHGFRQEKNNWAHENRVKDVSRNVCFCQKAIRDVTNRLSEASIVTQGGIVTFRALCSQAIVLLSSNLYLSTSPLELSVAKQSYSSLPICTRLESTPQLFSRRQSSDYLAQIWPICST